MMKLHEPEHKTASRNAFKKASIASYPLPDEACLALNKVHWQIENHDAVLLVHDMQQYWLDFFVDAAPLSAAVSKLIQAARASNTPIIYTRGERPRHASERALGVQMWGLGLAHPNITESDAAITTTLKPKPQDFVIDKLRVNAFFGTPLAEILQKIGRRQLIICGVFAHHGILMTSAEAFMRNYQVHLISDAVGDYNEADHWMALRYVAQTSGCIAMLDQAVQALNPATQRTQALHCIETHD